jgi:hypothetical protein
MKSSHSDRLNRRRFCALAVLTPLAVSSASAHELASASPSSSSATRTGNGEWIYDVVPGWGQLPPGTTYGGTHGAIATDQAGSVYVSTQSETGILVFSAGGVFIKTIATQFPEAHSIFYARENGDEVFYTTVQKGTPHENWLFVKMKTDGTVLQKITAPPEAGFKAPNESPMDMATHASFASTSKASIAPRSAAKAQPKVSSIAAMASPSTRATTNPTCSYAIAKTDASATSISMENSCAPSPSIYADRARSASMATMPWSRNSKAA